MRVEALIGHLKAFEMHRGNKDREVLLKVGNDWIGISGVRLTGEHGDRAITFELTSVIVEELPDFILEGRFI